MYSLKSCLKILFPSLLLLTLCGCIYPIPYPTEPKAYYICTKQLKLTYSMYQSAKECQTMDPAALKKARDYWSDAKVDQALQQYDCCIDKAQLALDLMVCPAPLAGPQTNA